jgi:acyl dehydratase
MTDPETTQKFRYFEDFKAGEVFEYGAVTLTEDEIIDFASKYDPQTIHTDREKAARSPYGGLIASGWQTGSVAMRMVCDGIFLNSSSLGSPGVDELRWLKPVRPGDTLSIRLVVTKVTPCRRRPEERGWVDTFLEMLNQDGDVVMTWKSTGIFARRPAAAA